MRMLLEGSEVLDTTIQRLKVPKLSDTYRTHSTESIGRDRSDVARADDSWSQRRASVDISYVADDKENSKHHLTASFKRRSHRWRQSRQGSFGHDVDAYDAIRERVLQERAVTNAIEALQERLKLLCYMHDDCLQLNKEMKEKKLQKLCTQRQMELIYIVFIFAAICLLVSIAIVIIYN